MISERVTGIEISGCFGARLIEETYGRVQMIGFAFREPAYDNPAGASCGGSPSLKRVR